MSAFMTKELPASGWTKITAVPACFYAWECWQYCSTVIVRDAEDDPLNRRIA